jgi:hypothetical protein
VEVRASDADRERAAGALTRHCGEGRLTLEELESRLAEVYAATTTAEVADALRDLPPLMPPRPDEVGRLLRQRRR